MANLKAWLASLGLERYAPAFEAAEVDLDALPHLTENDLKEIGLPIGPRRRVLAARRSAATEGLAAEHAGPAPAEEPASAPERRQITVMFVDLVGSTRLSVEVDPEVMADLLKHYQDVVAHEIGAAGGRVAKYLGDGVLAYFGWPHAREDAAECSVRCGFQVIGQVGRLHAPDGQPMRCRVGIATGLVVVGGVTGEGGAREDAIAGEAPNLAARLQALAAPDAMIISDATHRQLGRLFECEFLGEPVLAGFSAPVRAWRPLRHAPQVSRFRAARAFRTRFIGREHELALLADRWQTASEGMGRTVLVFGEAGMGKSRLAEALHERIGEESHGFVTWQCSPYHQTKALYPAVEHLTRAAGILDGDAPAAGLAKLAALLGAVPGSSDAVLPLFATLLAIPPEAGYVPPILPPNQLRAATIGALADWVRHLAATQPLLLLIEDAHWIDATTVELITRLLGAGVDVPLLTVVTARPQFASPWSGRADVSIIGLDRLNNRDCQGLVKEIAPAALQSATVDEIVSRSDGNPLFLEELSAAVFDAAAHSRQQTVPDSLQSSLMARLDQLGDAKHTAQICSVLGRRFATPLLALVSNQPADLLDVNLTLLVERDVIRPVGGEIEGRYVFKHALVRDAAYESLLLSERRRLHEACGRGLEAVFPDVGRTEPELLAQHFRLAGLPDEASVYAERAGDRAAAAHALAEAIASYQDALDQTALMPETVERDRRALAIILKLGPAVAIIKGIQAPELRDLYSRAEALSRAVGDTDAAFKAVWGLWFNANISGELDDAARFAQNLVAIGEQSGNEGHRLEALHCRWSSSLFGGDYRAVVTDAQRGVELYDKDRHHTLGLSFGGHDPGVCALGARGDALIISGNLEAGLASVAQAIALAETLDHPGSLGHGLVQGLSVTTLVPPELIGRYAERLLELGAKFNVAPQQAMGAYHLGWFEAETQDREKGLARMEAVHDRVTATGSMVLLYRLMYVDQLLKAGRTEAALAAADRALAARRFRDRGYILPELLRLRGESLAALGRKADAFAALKAAEAMAKRDGAGLLERRAAASYSRVVAGEEPPLG
jgi:class 3 adenylate cyclase